MPVDVDSAERFILANSRLLERHQLAVLLHGALAPSWTRYAPAATRTAASGTLWSPTCAPQRASRPQPFAPWRSWPRSGLDDSMIAGAAPWIARIADADGGLPFVMPTAAAYPHAPWMVPSDGGSHLTFAIAGILWEAGSTEPWLQRATEWCWARLEGPAKLSGYWVKFGLDFLDKVGDETRAVAAIDRLRPQLGPDGAIPVPGGTENERLTPLALSDRPARRSRALFNDEQIEADLDRLEAGQQSDGGWTFNFLGWSAGQSCEWWDRHPGAAGEHACPRTDQAGPNSLTSYANRSKGGRAGH